MANFEGESDEPFEIVEKEGDTESEPDERSRDHEDGDSKKNELAKKKKHWWQRL